MTAGAAGGGEGGVARKTGAEGDQGEVGPLAVDEVKGGGRCELELHGAHFTISLSVCLSQPPEGWARMPAVGVQPVSTTFLRQGGIDLPHPGSLRSSPPPLHALLGLRCTQPSLPS